MATTQNNHCELAAEAQTVASVVRGFQMIMLALSIFFTHKLLKALVSTGKFTKYQITNEQLIFHLWSDGYVRVTRSGWKAEKQQTFWFDLLSLKNCICSTPSIKPGDGGRQMKISRRQWSNLGWQCLKKSAVLPHEKAKAHMLACVPSHVQPIIIAVCLTEVVRSSHISSGPGLSST